MPSSEQCDHILGSNETIGGDWLIFKSDCRVRCDRVFNYCPMCGVRLDETEKLSQTDEHEEMIHG